MAIHNKTIHLRTFENNRIKSRAFFKSSIEKLVIEDSISAAEFYADSMNYPTHVVIDIKRADHNIFEAYTPTLRDQEASLAPRITTQDEQIMNRMALAAKRVDNANASMLLSMALSVAGGVVLSSISTSSNPGDIQSAAIAGITLGAGGTILFINALIQNSKASQLLRMP